MTQPEKRNFSTSNSAAFSVDIPGVEMLFDSQKEGISYDRIAESLNEVQEAINLNEPKMCVNAILELLAIETEGTDTDGRDSMILDLCAGKGQIGQLLSDQGFIQVYGQEGSQAKKQSLLKKGYKEIETCILGKVGLPKTYRRTFDFVTCAGGLGTNHLPAHCFSDMLATLKSRGYCIFTVSQKHLRSDTPFGMGYTEEI